MKKPFKIIPAYLFSILIVILDAITPVGYVEWVFYIIPVILICLYTGTKSSVFFTSLCSVLIVLGAFLSPPSNVPPILPIYDRTVGIITLWGTMLLMRSYGKARVEISEFLRAEEALKWEKDLLQNVMNSAGNSHLVYLDRDFNFIRVNETYARTCGYKPEEMVGKNHFALYPHEENEAIFARVRDTGVAEAYHDKPFEFPDQPERGTTYWDWTLAPVKDDSGAVKGLVFSLTETTERKRAEDALRQSEESLAKAQAITHMANWELDIKTNRVNGSKELYRLFHLEPDATLDAYVEKFHPDDRFSVVESINAAIAEGKPYNIDYRIVPSPGAIRYIHAEGETNRDNDGRPITFFGTVQDITERKKAEAVMKMRFDILEYAGTHSLEELLQKTLDEIGAFTNSPIGFYHFVEPDQKTLSLQAWSTKTEKEFCTAEGKGMHYDLDQAGVWTDCVYERRPVIHNDYQSLPHRKGLPEGHATVIRELVVPIMREDQVVAILGVGNKPADYTEKDAELVSFIADVAWEITRRKRGEEELHKLTEELKRSNEDLQEFAYAVSHDLQEPLRGVAGFAKLLEKRYGGKLDEKADEFIDYIIDGTERMEMLIKDLLEYSLVSAKGIVFEPTNCSVALEQAIRNLRSAIEEGGAEVTYDLLPTVMGDEAQLSRLFQNLMNNAIKFRSKEPLKIHISARREGDEWIFSIRDNGIGIDPKQAERIFVIFQRLHTKQEYPGTGLGLALCKRILEHHGGRIWVESEPGKGSTFVFTIPTKEATA